MCREKCDGLSENKVNAEFCILFSIPNECFAIPNSLYSLYSLLILPDESENVPLFYPLADRYILYCGPMFVPAFVLTLFDMGGGGHDGPPKCF